MIKLLADKTLFPSTPNIFHAQLLDLRNSAQAEKLDARNLALLDALIYHPFWAAQSATEENIHALLMTLPEDTSSDVRIATIEFWRNHFENLYLTKDKHFYTLISRGIPFNTRTVFNPALMHTLFQGEVYLDLTLGQQILIHKSLQKALYLFAPIYDLRYNGAFPGLDLVFNSDTDEAYRLAHSILPVQQAYSLISEADFTPAQLEDFLEAYAEWIALYLDHNRHLLIILLENKLQNWIENVRVTANNLFSLYDLINEPFFQNYQQLIITKILKLLESESLSEDIKQNEQIQKIAKQRIADIINEFNANDSWKTISMGQYKELLYLWKIVDNKSGPEQPSVEEFLATIIFNNYAKNLQINDSDLTHILDIVGGQTESKKCYMCLIWIIDTEDNNKQKTLIQYVKRRFYNLDNSEILLTKGEDDRSATVNANYQQMYQKLVKIYNRTDYDPATLLATDGLHDLAQHNPSAFLQSLESMPKESRITALLERDRHDNTPIYYLLIRNKSLIPNVISNIFALPATSDINILRAYYLQLCNLYLGYIDILDNMSNKEPYNQQKKSVVLSAKQILEDPEKSLEEFRNTIKARDNDEKVILTHEKGNTIETVFGFFDIPLSTATDLPSTKLRFFQSTIEEVLLEQTENLDNTLTHSTL